MASASHLLDVYSVWVHVATDQPGWRHLRERVPALPKKPLTALGSVRHLAEQRDSNGQVQHFVVYIDLAGHQLDDTAATARLLVETCAHEAAHLAGMVLDHFGHEYGGSDEPHAYLVGWIAQWLWLAIYPDRTAAA